MERDYGVWKFSGKEKAKLILSYLGLCGLVSWLFYHSFWAVLPFLAGLPVFLKKSREKRIKERREELLTEFLTGIRAIASALDAGYSMENALGEALKETEKVYGMDGVFTEELREMDGEPVYMTFPSDTGNQCGHWALVGTQRWGAVSLIYGCGWSSYESAVETLGAKFYRRPPEGEEHCYG